MQFFAIVTSVGTFASLVKPMEFSKNWLKWTFIRLKMALKWTIVSSYEEPNKCLKTGYDLGREIPSQVTMIFTTFRKSQVE